MSKLQKAMTRLLAKPMDYTWDELLSLMNALDMNSEPPGARAGSLLIRQPRH
jgi:hypothetical protein